MKLINKNNKSKELSEEVQEKVIMNEMLSLKECTELLEYSINTLERTLDNTKVNGGKNERE